MPMVDIPTPDAVADYLGFAYSADSDSRNALISGRLPVTTALAMSYTRGAGFSADGTKCRADLYAVIVSACAREVSTEDPGIQRTQVGAYSDWNNATNQLWLLREILAMNNYRRLAQ